MISLFVSNTVFAATSQQKKIANTLDPFVVSILAEARSYCARDYNYSSKNYKKYIRKLYNGKLSAKQKSMIAASNTKASSYVDYYEASIGKISLSKVKSKYTNLFGTKRPTLKLPVVKSMKNVSSYYLGYAMDKKYAYSYSSEMELAYSTKLVSVKKTGSGKYTLKNRYDFYNHCMSKQRGEKPNVSVTATITVKTTKKSSYGYIITGLKIS